MKKGIIFTIDALIALSVFLIASLFILSQFSVDPTTSLLGTGIYTKSENLLRSLDKSEIFSSSVKLHQEGNTDGAEQLLRAFLDDYEFPANLYVYTWDGNDLDEALVLEGNDFEQQVVARKILVMTISNSENNTGSEVTVEVNSSFAGKNVSAPVSIFNPTVDNLTDLTAYISVYNSSNDLQSWGADSKIVPTVEPGDTETVDFNLTIPTDAVIETYYVFANVTNSTGTYETGTDSFNVFLLGLAEMEVGT